MKVFLLKYRIYLGFTALLLLVVLTIVIRYERLPFSIIPKNPVKVTAVPVGTMTKSVPIVRTGSVESPTSVPVTAEFSGQISEVYVAEGQSVKAGQPLVKLFGASAASQSVTSSSGSAPVRQKLVINPQGQGDYDQALKEYNRYQKLYEQGAIARRQLESAAARLAALQDSATTTTESEAPAMSSEAPTVQSSGFATITAAINGIVTGLTAASNTAVQAGQQLLVLDSGEVQVAVAIEQPDLYLVHLGTPAAIEISGQVLQGLVASVYPTLGPNNIPAFRTYIKVTNDTAGLLKKGMSANVQINTGKSAVVLVVPVAAIVQDGQGLNYIFLAQQGKAVRESVEVGEPRGDFVEISANLPDPALVITSNLNDIKNGDAVVVLE